MDGRFNVVTLVVTNQARSLEFFTEKVGFEKKTDVSNPGGSRWVTVGLHGQELEAGPLGGRILVSTPRKGDFREEVVPRARPADRPAGLGLQEEPSGDERTRGSNLVLAPLEHPVGHRRDLPGPRWEPLFDEPAPWGMAEEVGGRSARGRGAPVPGDPAPDPERGAPGLRDLSGGRMDAPRPVRGGPRAIRPARRALGGRLPPPSPTSAWCR